MSRNVFNACVRIQDRTIRLGNGRLVGAGEVYVWVIYAILDVHLSRVIVSSWYKMRQML